MLSAGRIKGALARGLAAAGVLAAARRWRCRRGEVVVLALHRVAGTPRSPLPMAIPLPWFECLLGEASRRYRIASWTACARAAAERRRPHLAMTFDDGYREHADTVWPLLRAAGAGGVFCLTTGIVDGREPFWWAVAAARFPLPAGTPPPLDRGGSATYGAAAEAEIATLKMLAPPALRRRVAALGAAASAAALAAVPAALTWEAARQMRAEGADVAAHGVSHAVLTRCDDATLTFELDEARRVLAERLGAPAELLAYPNGDCDPRVVDAARRAGFRWAFTTGPGRYRAGADPLRVPRVAVTPAMCSADGTSFCWPLFEAEILGIFDLLLLRRWRRRSG